MQERCVIAYGSRQLCSHEDKYPTHDLELAVVIYALKLWRHYLLGNRCEVYTDHQSLKYLFTQPDLNLRQQRWLEKIADFNLDISYTPGKANVMANALSRKAYCSELEVRIQQPLLYEELRKMNIEIVPHGHVNSLVIEQNLDSKIKGRQHYDSEIQNIKCYVESGKPSSFTIDRDDDDTLYFKGRLVVNSASANLSSAPEVMKEAHDTPLSIYPGSTKMYQDIRQRYWWSNMKQDILVMLMNVTFVVALRQNTKDLLEPCNPSLFLNGNGIRLRWTSSPVFLDHKMVMMLSLSSSTDSPKLLIFCLSRRQSLLASWQTYMFPELFPATIFRWRSVQIVAAFSPPSSGIVSKKLWALT